MSQFKIYVLYCFLERIILDLSTIILHEMVKIHEIDHRALGFGALLTEIFARSGIDLSTKISIPIDRYMIERNRVLNLLAELVIEGGLDALSPNHSEAHVHTDAPRDDDVPMIEAQPTLTSTSSAPTPASASTPEPFHSYSFYCAVGDFQHRTFDRLKEVERVLKSLDNSTRFSLIDYRSVDLRLQRLKRDKIILSLRRPKGS